MKRRLINKSTVIDRNTVMLFHFDGDVKDEVSGINMIKKGSGINVTSSHKKFGTGSLTGTNEFSDSCYYIENKGLSESKELTIDFFVLNPSGAANTGGKNRNGYSW